MTNTDVLCSPVKALACKWPDLPAQSRRAGRRCVRPGLAPMFRLVAHERAVTASTAIAAVFRPRDLQFAA